MENTALLIEQLLLFGMQHHFITALDAYAARNTLLDLFGLARPYADALPEHWVVPERPTALLDALVEAAAQKGLFDGEVDALRVNFEARIMGALMPRPSEVAGKFSMLRETQGAQAATDYFYDLGIRSNYIRTAQIAKNIQWDYASAYGNMEITINLTKPEKDPKTIAMERRQPASSYPKCMLCTENIGYAGRINFPARQNHRVVPLTLDGAQWYLQYSPYVYYNEHCIVFSGVHEPMALSLHALRQLLDFVRQFPHYTCGSNADLPIVGGSILSHMHFQGGRYTFPMHRAGTVASFAHEAYPALRMETLRWPVSALRVTGANAEQLLQFSTAFIEQWRAYSDESINVLAFTETDGIQTPHNTVTPILHYDAAQTAYVMDLAPRNNRTTTQYPDGIFHPHKEIHHIKKENIGLIEVMGLAILPARLEQQSAWIAEVLTGAKMANIVKKAAPEHAEWLDFLCEKYGMTLAPQAAQQAVREEIGKKFETCLEHAGVFKQTAEGNAAFGRFLYTLGCHEA